MSVTAAIESDKGDRHPEKSIICRTKIFVRLQPSSMDRLIPWFTSQGGTVDTEHFGLAEFSGQGWGAIALKDIPV